VARKGRFANLPLQMPIHSIRPVRQRSPSPTELEEGEGGRGKPTPRRGAVALRLKRCGSEESGLGPLIKYDIQLGPVFAIAQEGQSDCLTGNSCAR